MYFLTKGSTFSVDGTWDHLHVTYNGVSSGLPRRHINKGDQMKDMILIRLKKMTVLIHVPPKYVRIIIQ
jgi:hypothetical protein